MSKENILIAAWFHDSGFIKGAENHEEESVNIATEWLTFKKIKSEKINAIKDLILATKMGFIPDSDLKKVICDADCAHLASKNFFDLTTLLRKEWELTGNKNVDDIEWKTINIEFFTDKHKYYTDFALKNWSKGKAKNLSKLIKEKQEISKSLNKFNQKQKDLELKKNKSLVPERGVETMFRVALRNHITLSDIADTKANILLSVNAIIISMMFSTLIPKLDNPTNAYLILPSVIFIFFTVK